MSTITRFMSATVLVGLLAGCAPAADSGPTSSSDPAVTPTVSPSESASVAIPSSCDLPEMVAVIDGLGFTDAEDVTPPWEPAEGTDLKLALDNGGIACAWGPPNTDSGVVIYWVPVDEAVWSDATALWIEGGLESVDVVGLDEDVAYFVYQPQSETQEFPRWELNVRYDSLWIQVGTSSWTDPADGNDVVLTALDVATP